MLTFGELFKVRRYSRGPVSPVRIKLVESENKKRYLLRVTFSQELIKEAGWKLNKDGDTIDFSSDAGCIVFKPGQYGRTINETGRILVRSFIKADFEKVQKYLGFDLKKGAFWEKYALIDGGIVLDIADMNQVVE